MNTRCEVTDLLSNLQARGCRFLQVGENLRIRGAKLSEEELDTLRAHKATVFQVIKIGIHQVGKIGKVTWLFVEYPYQDRSVAYRLSGPPGNVSAAEQDLLEDLQPIPA